RFCRTDRETRTLVFKALGREPCPELKPNRAWKSSSLPVDVHDPETPRKPLPIKDKRSLRRVSMRDDEGEEDEDERA
ncbi:hypothetical protein, partial [Shinella zoogloeoides]|uniref:hypothetical protein n=1 Tax=Shinella zoogloeoides TaxID=352475 RepID=UPI0019CFA5FA